MRFLKLAIPMALAAVISPPAGARAQDLVLIHATVVDVNDGSLCEDARIRILGGRIDEVSCNARLTAERDRVVDVQGMFVLPGLIDAHVHVGSVEQAQRALGTGVTTMRSMGTSHYVDVGLRELQRDGGLDAPEYLAAGYHVRPPAAEAFFLDHPELGPMYGRDVRGVNNVRDMTRAVLSRGVDWVKTNATERAGLPDTDPRKQFYSLEELQAIVDEAASHGVPVAAHAHGDAGGRDAVMAGVRSIEHGTYLSPETLQLMVERQTYLVPTIAIVRDLTIPGGDYDNAVLNMRGRHMLPRVQEMARTAHELGVKIVAATDTGYGPESTTVLAHELMELVEVGLSPLEALQAATTTAAELLGIQDRVGQVARHYEGDLIIVERNPLEDIGVIQDVLMVVSDGTVAAERGDWSRDRPRS